MDRRGRRILLCRDQSGALDLRRALALTGYRFAHVDDEGPMAGRTFADVACGVASHLALSGLPPCWKLVGVFMIAGAALAACPVAW
jgi:hypothetical protein